MSKPSLIQLFRCRWQEIARQFWPETPREQLESDLARLDAELGQRQVQLLKCRKKIEKLHFRLKRREHRRAQLAVSVEMMPADPIALAELECQQGSIDRLRERVRQLEVGYDRRLACLRQRKQTWAELRERLLSGSLPKSMNDESDPDDPF